MFEAYYGFISTPFTRNLPVDRLFTTPQQEEVLARLAYAGINSQPTVIPAANIAATAAISLLALEAVSHMTEIQFQAEKRYQVAISMAKSLLEKGLLTQEEYAVIDTNLLEKFQPALGTLLSETR
jgi:hypothetical protein